ncbi:hypothetical protein [Caloramator sp. mosi_1]
MINNNQFVKKVIAVKHDETQIEEELRTIVALGENFRCNNRA